MQCSLKVKEKKKRSVIQFSYFLVFRESTDSHAHAHSHMPTNSHFKMKEHFNKSSTMERLHSALKNRVLETGQAEVFGKKSIS